MVGLDLSSSDTDMARLSPAVAVKRLDPPEDAVDPTDPEADPSSFYLCLMDDNRQDPQPHCDNKTERWSTAVCTLVAAGSRRFSAVRLASGMLLQLDSLQLTAID